MNNMFRLIFLCVLLILLHSCKSTEMIFPGNYAASWDGGGQININILEDSSYTGIYIYNDIEKLDGRIISNDTDRILSKNAMKDTFIIKKIITVKKDLFFITYSHKKIKLHKVSNEQNIDSLILFRNDSKFISFEYCIEKKKVYFQKSTITLFADGSFTIIKFSNKGNNFVKGQWQIHKNVIILECIWKDEDDEILNHISSAGFNKYYGIVYKNSNFYLGSNELVIL